MEQRLCEWPAGAEGAPKAITRLEGQIEEQKQLRLQDAKQVEAKAARIKEWVTNKLRELEQQNQLLREQNDRCNQQLELLRNHIATQGSRNCLPLTSSEPHYSTPVRHRRNLSIGTTNLTQTNSAVENLVILPTTPNTSTDGDTTHDYAEIYTPSRGVNVVVQGGNNSRGGSSTGDKLSPPAACPRQMHESTSYQDISVPVYATVKGRASQIRSMPFTGDSSDDSSDGEDCALHTTPSHNPAYAGQSSQMLNNSNVPTALSHATTNGQCSSSDTSLSASSPSKSTRHSSRACRTTTRSRPTRCPARGAFVLKNGTLSYWKSQSEVNRKPQGQIGLGEACKISRNDGAATFEIFTGTRTYYLTADSIATMEDWIRVLQNVQRRNATKLLLSKEDNKPTIQGWLTKVKNGHAKKSWCNPTGQINMRDARVEDVEHVSDSDSEEKNDDGRHLTVAIYPQHQGPTYLLLESKAEKDAWLYHLTVVSGASSQRGTHFEQLVQKLMETDGEPNCVLWRHPTLLYSKENITSPLTSLNSEALQAEALKLFKQAGIDYHVVLAQNALQQCLEVGELPDELVSALCKQCAPHAPAKHAVQVRRHGLLRATQTFPTHQHFICTATAAVRDSVVVHLRHGRRAPLLSVDCKSNPPTYSFIQGWQLLALAVSLFVPRNNRLLWYLKLHLSRHSDTKTECGKYAAYCARALERTIRNGGRTDKPSRMEVLSILLKNPYHHSLPHAIPEFLSTLSSELGCRESAASGFALFSDDPIEKDLEHHIKPDKKLCDVISRWETALREKGSGKFENSRVIRLTYRNRLYYKSSVRTETDKERLLLCYQVNQQGRFPVSRELAAELGALMAQLDMGDYSSSNTQHNQPLAHRFYPYRYRAGLTNEELRDVEEKLRSKWIALKGRSTVDCVRIYLNCTRKWPFFGATLFQARIKQPELSLVWLAVSEDGVTVLELASMSVIGRYALTSIGLFGGLQDDLMMLIDAEDSTSPVHKMLISLNKLKLTTRTRCVQSARARRR
ncbi:unnamed protein product [Leptidea sinapis]|uniref:PH domain-containing protein n=1 Tax=Leptidea sinapis TaxID=189913 RepID=A0A5E4QKN0_9NEOP|nr:unnamed protein product [Leptidea sinapis]